MTEVEPEVDSFPVHVPPADVQSLAFVDDQVSFEGCPGATDFGLADSDTVGGVPTLTRTESVNVWLPRPHVSRYLASDCG